MTGKMVSVEAFRNAAGTELGPSDWVLIDQHRIDQFADATGDHQYIHVDPERAADSPFGSTIAHGFLTLSMISHLLAQIMLAPEGATMGVNYGSEKIRFLTPVKVDSRIRVRARIERVSERPGGQFHTRLKTTVEIENETRPALVADIILLYIVPR